METIDVTLELQGRRFPFAVCSRPLRLGPAGTVPYYWMDGSAFRRRSPGPNFRACVDHWWAAVEMTGAAAEADTLVSRVWAEFYPLVNTARSLQDVYLDARLVPKAARGGGSARGAGHAFSLPAAETDRLRAVARSRDTASVRAELEGLFLGRMPTPAELPAFQEEARAWIKDGVAALLASGSEGLAAHVATTAPKIVALRKRGGDDRARLFLNLFSYESKVAFYLCHANAWIGLIPWLREHRGLDAHGERFLRLWHHQNQPGDDEVAGPGGNHDAFCGQVLSLHPLSAFVMNDPAHLQALGAWIAHPEHDRLVAQGLVGTCEAYWDFVATVLIAAHEYKQTRERWDRTRTVRVDAGGVDRTAGATRDESPPQVATALEDYAAAHGVVCPTCAGPARYHGHEPGDDEDEASLVDFRCHTCHAPFRSSIPSDDFRAWLSRNDD